MLRVEHNRMHEHDHMDKEDDCGTTMCPRCGCCQDCQDCYCPCDDIECGCYVEEEESEVDFNAAFDEMILHSYYLGDTDE